MIYSLKEPPPYVPIVWDKMLRPWAKTFGGQWSLIENRTPSVQVSWRNLVTELQPIFTSVKEAVEETLRIGDIVTLKFCKSEVLREKSDYLIKTVGKIHEGVYRYSQTALGEKCFILERGNTSITPIFPDDLNGSETLVMRLEKLAFIPEKMFDGLISEDRETAYYTSRSLRDWHESMTGETK